MLKLQYTRTCMRPIAVHAFYPNPRESNHKRTAIKLVGWQILFALISPMRHCPSPCSARTYKGLVLPSVPDMSHSKPGWERVDRENPWSGPGLLSRWSWVLAHISWLPGCLLTAISRPCSFKPLAGHLWPAKHSAGKKNKRDKEQMRWDLSGQRKTRNIHLHLLQLWLSQNLSHSLFLFLYLSAEG